MYKVFANGQEWATYQSVEDVKFELGWLFDKSELNHLDKNEAFSITMKKGNKKYLLTFRPVQ